MFAMGSVGREKCRNRRQTRREPERGWTPREDSQRRMAAILGIFQQRITGSGRQKRLRPLFAFLLRAGVAVLVALLFKLNTGYALFVAPPYRVEVSLNAFILLVIG